ncbi:MAG: SDR family oxidoreductase [Gammaproteobacteria bacterium]|nr:SDR family oxidoreductase [Gammaproteobacteria bacterium]
MSIDLSDKGVVVTGAGTSVGRAMAEKFLGTSARVHICDIDEGALRRTLADVADLSGTVADVGDPAQVATLASDAIAALGHVDILVNTVGVAGPIGPVEELDIQDWRAAIDTNLNSMFFTTRKFVPGMKQRNSGVIINFSSASTLTRPVNRSNYICSKGGVEGLTLALARELGPFGIRCNAIRPGAINNDRLRTIVDAIAERLGCTSDEATEDFLNYVSMRTVIEPSEVADMVLFLCSPAAAHVTGQLIGVCGGVEWER